MKTTISNIGKQFEPIAINSRIQANTRKIIRLADSGNCTFKQVIKSPIMKHCLYCFLLLAGSFSLRAQQTAPAVATQIKLAVLAAPEEKREGAAVYGYDEKGSFTLLRKGSNEMICVADNPAQKGFSVACYHKDLDPFMKIGRDLRASGKSFEEIDKAREAAVQSGQLKLVSQPSTLFVYSAKDEDCDLTTGTVKNGYLRYVIYIPYATAASTGLPTKADAPGMPWIMDAGTYRAHIMINPAPAKEK